MFVEIWYAHFPCCIYTIYTDAKGPSVISFLVFQQDAFLKQGSQTTVPIKMDLRKGETHTKLSTGADVHCISVPQVRMFLMK